jgi:helicase
MKKEEIIRKVLKLNGFFSLNPVQKEAIEKGVLEKKNLVISSPTSSGKTLIAELAGLNTSLNEKKKMVYLCPLVALAREKYENFKKYESLGLKIALSVGNFDSDDPWLSKKDWIICSNEKMDSLIRHGAEWIKDIGLIVVDEIHLIDDSSRGPTLEILLTILREILPKAQILALSATIKNSDEIGEWLGAEVIKSDFRPVPLYYGIATDGKIKVFGKKIYKIFPGPIEEAISENTLLLKKQLIFFLSTRRNAESLAERLSKFVPHYLSLKEKNDLEKLAKKILGALSSPTTQCQKLANCIRNGVAFYHSGLVFSQRALIEEAYKKGLIKVITSTTALCVHPETLVYCENGILKKIKEVEIGEKILTFDFKNFKFKFVKVLDKVARPLYKEEELFEITTNSGKKIIATSTHPFLTLKEGKFHWVSIFELKKKDYLAISQKIPEPLKNILSLFDILPKNSRIADRKLIKDILEKLRKKYFTVPNISKKFKINYKTLDSYFNRNISLPIKYFQLFIKDLNIKIQSLPKIIHLTSWKQKDKIKFSQDLKPLSHLIGILLGDGNLLKVKSFNQGTTYLISLTSSNEKWLKQYQSLLKKFGIETKIRPNSKFPELKQISFKSKILGRILHENLGFPIGKKAKIIQIPSFFLKSNELLKEVISGLIDTDGSVGKDKIEISSISKELLKQIQLLLLRFGIYSYLEKRKKKPTELADFKNPSYRLSIFGKSAIIFKRNFNLLHYKKKKKLKLLKEKSSTYSKDIIPGAGLYLKQILNETKLSQWKFRKITNLTPYNYLVKSQNFLRKSILNNFSKLSNPSKTLSFLRNLARSPLSWEEIKNIKRVNKKSFVYDLTTTDNFWANGFIIHNSYGINLPNFRAVVRDIKRYQPGLGSIYLPVLEVQQMFGRSGRPQFDEWGEGILIAKKREEEEELKEHYIEGELEEIESKISSESSLRMHILSLISNRFCSSEKSLLEFFLKTFFGFKFKNTFFLAEKVKRILELFEDWDFIKSVEVSTDGETELRYFPTRLGKRISQLYIDPLSAIYFIEGLKRAAFNFSDFTLLHLLCSSVELKPGLNLSLKDIPEIEEKIAQNEEKFLVEVPDQFDEEYEEFLKEVKLALALFSWINEEKEDEILKKYNLTPGELHSRLEISDWLCYSILEIGKILKTQKEIKREIRKLRMRLNFGIKEELLPLVRLKGIGKVRARLLFNSGIDKISKIKKVSQKDLAKILKSQKLAKKLKEEIK